MKNYFVYYIFFWCPNIIFMCFLHALEDNSSFFHSDSVFEVTSALPEEFQPNFPLSSPENKNVSAAETFNVIDWKIEFFW